MGRPTQQPETLDSSTSKQSTVEPKKRRKTENLEGSDKDWEYLELILQQNKTVPNVDSSHLNNDSNALLFPYIPLIFFTLHLIYEEMKLDELMNGHLQSLGEVYKYFVDRKGTINFFFAKLKIRFLHTVPVSSVYRFATGSVLFALLFRYAASYLHEFEQYYQRGEC